MLKMLNFVENSDCLFQLSSYFQSVTVGITYSISFLDGLDITKQKFTGKIGKKNTVISSQGALNYEGIIIKENPNKTAPGARK